MVSEYYEFIFKYYKRCFIYIFSLFAQIRRISDFLFNTFLYFVFVINLFQGEDCTDGIVFGVRRRKCFYSTRGGMLCWGSMGCVFDEGKVCGGGLCWGSRRVEGVASVIRLPLNKKTQFKHIHTKLIRQQTNV